MSVSGTNYTTVMEEVVYGPNSAFSASLNGSDVGKAAERAIFAMSYLNNEDIPNDYKAMVSGLSKGGRMAEWFRALDFNAVTQVQIPLWPLAGVGLGKCLV